MLGSVRIIADCSLEHFDLYVSGTRMGNPRGQRPFLDVDLQLVPNSDYFAMALLKITDASGRQWEYSFLPQGTCTIGRAPDNTVVLDDPRASRYHAHVTQSEYGIFTIIDGAMVKNQLRRCSNKVFINGAPRFVQQL